MRCHYLYFFSTGADLFIAENEPHSFMLNIIFLYHKKEPPEPFGSRGLFTVRQT